MKRNCSQSMQGEEKKEEVREGKLSNQQSPGQGVAQGTLPYMSC